MHSDSPGQGAKTGKVVFKHQLKVGREGGMPSEPTAICLVDKDATRISPSTKFKEETR
jgi:hypothetical protein